MRGMLLYMRTGIDAQFRMHGRIRIVENRAMP